VQIADVDAHLDLDVPAEARLKGEREIVGRGTMDSTAGEDCRDCGELMRERDEANVLNTVRASGVERKNGERRRLVLGQHATLAGYGNTATR
jgi:hypothetical protein